MKELRPTFFGQRQEEGMKRSIAFCLVLAIATMQGAPAFAQTPRTAAEAHMEAADACASVTVPGYQELLYKLGGGTVTRGGKLVYEMPTPQQLFNPAHATPLDSGIAAAAVRQFKSCGVDAQSMPVLTALQMFANGLITYGLLSLQFANMQRDAVERLNASR
jgi:hypothetical protein